MLLVGGGLERSLYRGTVLYDVIFLNPAPATHKPPGSALRGLIQLHPSIVGIYLSILVAHAIGGIDTSFCQSPARGKETLRPSLMTTGVVAVKAFSHVGEW
jgi:hypothetical protein